MRISQFCMKCKIQMKGIAAFSFAGQSPFMSFCAPEYCAAGLRIPEDISITGYDGVAMIQMCQPQLTTVEQDVSRIGREAARKLVHLIEQPRTTLPEIISVPCRLIVGKTVAKLG